VGELLLPLLLLPQILVLQGFIPFLVDIVADLRDLYVRVLLLLQGRAIQLLPPPVLPHLLRVRVRVGVRVGIGVGVSVRVRVRVRVVTPCRGLSSACAAPTSSC
jgi:hypothetical protein